MINCNLVQYLLYTSVSKDKKGCAVIISEVKFTQSCLTLCDPHGLYSPWNSPGQKTGVGSLYLLQGIFPTQGSNPGLQHCRQILYQLIKVVKHEPSYAVSESLEVDFLAPH